MFIRKLVLCQVIFPLARRRLKLSAIKLGIRQIKSRSFVPIERLSLEQVNRITQGDHRLVKKLIRDDALAKVNYSRSKHKRKGMKKKWRRVQTLSSDSENETSDNDKISTKTSTDVHENNGDEIRDRSISTCTVLPKREHIRQNNTSTKRSGNKLNRQLDITNNTRNKNDSDLLLPKTNQSKLFQNVVPPDKSPYDKAKVTTVENDPNYFPKRLNKYVHRTRCSDPVLNSSNDNSREHCVQIHSANHADNNIKSHHSPQSSLKTSDQNSFNSQFKISLPNAKLNINVLDTQTKYKQKKNDDTLMKKVPDTDKTKHTKEPAQVGKHTKSVDHKTDNNLFLNHHKNSTSVEPSNGSKSPYLSKNSDSTIKTQDGDKVHKHFSRESCYSKKEEKFKTVDGTAKNYINKKNESGLCVNQKKNVSKQKLFDPIVDKELFTPDIIMTKSGVKKTTDRLRNKEHDQSDCKKETEKTGNKDKNDITKSHESCKHRDGEKRERNENRVECDKKNIKRRQSHTSSDDHNEKSNKCHREKSVDSKKDNTDCADKKENRDKYLKNDSKSERMASGNKSNHTDKDFCTNDLDGENNLINSKRRKSSESEYIKTKQLKTEKLVDKGNETEFQGFEFMTVELKQLFKNKLSINKQRKSSIDDSKTDLNERLHSEKRISELVKSNTSSSICDENFIKNIDNRKSSIDAIKDRTDGKRDENLTESKNNSSSDLCKSSKGKKDINSNECVEKLHSNKRRKSSDCENIFHKKIKSDKTCDTKPNSSEIDVAKLESLKSDQMKISTEESKKKDYNKNIEEKHVTKKERKVPTKDQEPNLNKSEVKNIEEKHVTKKDRKVSTEDQEPNLNKSEVKNIEEKHVTKKDRKVSTEDQEPNLNKSEVKNIEEKHMTKKDRKVSTEDQEPNLNKSEVKNIEEKHMTKKDKKVSTEDQEPNLNKSEVKNIVEKRVTEKERKVSTEDQEPNLNKSEVKNIEEKHMTKKDKKVSTEDQEPNLNKSEVKNIVEKRVTEKERKVSTEDQEPNLNKSEVKNIEEKHVTKKDKKVSTEDQEPNLNKSEVKNIEEKHVTKKERKVPTKDQEPNLNKSEVKNIEEKHMTKKDRKVSTEDQEPNLNKSEVKNIEEKHMTKKDRKVSTEDQEPNLNKSEVKNIEEKHVSEKERKVSTEDQEHNLNKSEVKNIEEKHMTKKDKKVSTEDQEPNLNKSEVKNIVEKRVTEKERKVSTEDQEPNLNKSEVKNIEEKHVTKKDKKVSTEDQEPNLNKSEVKNMEEKHVTKKEKKVSTKDQDPNLNKSEFINIEEKHMTKKERKVLTEDQEHMDLGDSSSTKLCKSSDSRTEVAVNNSQDYHSSKKCRKSVDSNRNNYSICDKNRTPQNLHASETNKLTCSINISSIKDLPGGKINSSGTQSNTLLSFEGTDKEMRTNLENNETKDLPFINTEEEISYKKRKMSIQWFNGENSTIQNTDNGFKLKTESNLQKNKIGFINPVLDKKMENLDTLASNILTIIPACDISTQGQYNKQIETSNLRNTENTLQTTFGESETSKLHLLNNDVDKASFENDESGVTGLEKGLQHENVFNSAICDRPDNSTLSILIKDSATCLSEEGKEFNKENIISTHDFKSAKSIQGDQNLQPIREANVEVESDLSPQETGDGIVLNVEQINSVIEETPKPSDNLKNDDCRLSSNMNCSVENCDNNIHSEETSSFATKERSSGCTLFDTIIEESTSDNISSKINTSQENLLDKQTYSSALVNKITCGINPTNELISSQAEEINVNNVIQVDDAVKYGKNIQTNKQTKNGLVQDAKFKWMRSCDEYVSEKVKVNVNHGTSLVHNPISEPNSDKTERSDLQARPELKVYNVTFNSSSDTLPIIKSIQSRQVSMSPKSDNFKTSVSTGTLITNKITPQNESPGFFPSKDNENSITGETETLNTVTVPDKILIQEKLDEVVDKQNVSVQINTQIVNNTLDNVAKDHHESLQNTYQNKHFNSTKNALLVQTNVSNQPKISPSYDKKPSTISTTNFRKILSANVRFQNGVGSVSTPNSANVGLRNGVRSISTSNIKKILPANVGFQNGVRSNRFYPNKFNKPNIIPNQNQSLRDVVLTAEQRRLINYIKKFNSAQEKSVENVTKSVNVSSSTTNDLKKEQPVVEKINKTSKIDRINKKNLTLFGIDCDEPEYETLNNSSPDAKTSPSLSQKRKQPRNENIFKDSCNEDSSSSFDSDFRQKEKKTNTKDLEKIKIVKPCHKKVIKPASTKEPLLLKINKEVTSNGWRINKSTKIKQINQEQHSVTAKCNESPSQVLPSMPTIDDSVTVQDLLNTLDGVNNSVQEGHDTQKACTLYPAPPSPSLEGTKPALLPLSCTIKVNNSKIVPTLVEEQTLQQLLSSEPKNVTIVLEKNTTVGENNNICDSFLPKVKPKDFITYVPNINSKNGSTHEQISVHDEFSDQNKTTVVEGKYPDGNNSSKLQSNTSPTIQQNSKEQESNHDELRQIELFLANGESMPHREKESIEVNKFNCQPKYDNKRTSVLDEKGKENSFNEYLVNSSNVSPGQVNNCNSEESKIGKIRVKSGKELGITTWGNFTPIETNCLGTWCNVFKPSGEIIKPISSSLVTQETVTTQGKSNTIVHKDVFSTFFESESVSVTESVPVSESVHNTESEPILATKSAPQTEPMLVTESVPETQLTHETEPIPAVESAPETESMRVIEPASETESAHETESIKEELLNEDLQDDAETLPAQNVTAINTSNSSSLTPVASVASDISTAEVSFGESSGQALNVVHLSSQNKEPSVPPTVEQVGAALPAVVNSQLNSKKQNIETNQSELLCKNMTKMLSKPDRYWTTNKIQCAVVYKDVFDGLDQTIDELAEILHLVIMEKKSMVAQIASCRKLKSDSLIKSETERIEKVYQENIKMRGATFCCLFHSISGKIFSKTKDQILIDFLFILYIKLIESLLKIDTNHEVYIFSGRTIVYELICTAGIKNAILNNIFNAGDDEFKTRCNQVRESLKTVYQRKFSEQEVLLLERATDQNHTATHTTNINDQQQSLGIQSNLLQVIPFPEIKDDDVFENLSSQEQVNFETENTFTANESVSNNGAIDSNYFGENDMIDYSSLQVSNLNQRGAMSTIDQLPQLATSLSSQSKPDNYTNSSGPCLMPPTQSNQMIPSTYIASNSDQMICNSERNHASSDDVYYRQMASRRHSEPTYTPVPSGFNPPALLRGRSVVENVSKPMINTAQTIQSIASTNRPTYQQNNTNSNHSSSKNLNSQIPHPTPIQSVPSQNIGLGPFVQPLPQSRLLNQSYHSNRDSTPILPQNRQSVNNHHYLHPGSVQTPPNKQFAQNHHPSNPDNEFVTNRNIQPNLNPNSLRERTLQTAQLQQLILQRQQQSYMASLLKTRQMYNPTSNYTNTLQNNATPNMHMMAPQQVYSAAKVQQNNQALFQHNLQGSYPKPNMIQPRTAAATSSPNLPICFYPSCNNQANRTCTTCHSAYYCSAECQNADWRDQHYLICI